MKGHSMHTQVRPLVGDDHGSCRNATGGFPWTDSGICRGLSWLNGIFRYDKISPVNNLLARGDERPPYPPLMRPTPALMSADVVFTHIYVKVQPAKSNH